MEGAYNKDAQKKFEAAKALLAASEIIQENHVREAQVFLKEIQAKH